jgi:uncharacterized protein
VKNSKIHKFAKDGGYFIIDPPSGSAHISDKLAFDMLGELEPPLPENTPERVYGIFGGFSVSEIDECYGELYGLYKGGALFSGDGDCRRYAEAVSAAPLKALCLHVSHDCNLRCGYCFAGTGGYGGERTLMSPETAAESIDFLVRNSGERTLLEADFFGGEPLMAWETVTAAVDYARSREEEWGKRFKFTITTNGLLLDDEKIDYINREMCNCVLSLDGREETNDRIRKTLSGGGSYGAVTPKFQKLVKNRNKPGFTDYYVRGTFTAYNLDFSEDATEMARLGFRNISIEPVTAPDDRPYAIKREHIPRVFEEYDRLYSIIKNGERDINFFHFNVDLKGGPCVIRRLRGCGCGGEYAAVTPEGELYPCHRFIGAKEWRSGNVSRNGLSREKRDYFAKTHIYSKTGCADCWARFYCSGGCNALSYERYGDARATDGESVECRLMKKRLECAIALNAV